MAKRRDDIVPMADVGDDRPARADLAEMGDDVDVLRRENESLAENNQHLRDELDAMRREMVALRQRLENQEPAPARAAVADGPAGRYLVRLQDAPAWVVEAQSQSHAWPVYCSVAGILGSDHQPEIVPTDLPIGRVLPAAREAAKV